MSQEYLHGKRLLPSPAQIAETSVPETGADADFEKLLSSLTYKEGCARRLEECSRIGKPGQGIGVQRLSQLA
ncbi:MAG: hypothetical protein ABJK20_17395 [Halieaceae bacterium]